MKENNIEIDRDLCIGCGLCVTVCPTKTLSLEDDKATVSGGDSIFCGHCEAVCPQEAIRVRAIDREMSQYQTFPAEKSGCLRESSIHHFWYSSWPPAAPAAIFLTSP